ncbi:hypothetical protein BRC92_00355 [Halobacteriales archaeon QS_4_69_31]|nr:MAG: hypothetical protein BRC92_00355 [Halobacteriales archaeon QS_4_69_31]
MTYSIGELLESNYLDELALVTVGLAAAAVILGYAFVTSDMPLYVLAVLALLGQLVGLKRLDSRARRGPQQA